MFGLRAPELLIILGLALLIVGPKALPALGRSIGSAIRGVKQGMSDQDADEEKPRPGV